MKERFEGDNRPNLIDALKRQELLAGETALAEAMAEQGQLLEFPKGHKIIVQGAEDNDIYLLVAGDVSVVIKGNEYTTRKAGQSVGEMAAIEPSQKRSADVVAHDSVVALKLTNAQFMAIGRSFPQIWLPLARELARRLFQRNELIPPPNDYPKLFIISSTEALTVAETIRASLESDVFSTVWNQGVFFAGGYSLEALEQAVSESDFAIAIAQPDDIIESRGSRQATLRDNVLFELGLFMGKLGRHRALLIHPEVDGLKLPSDLQGLTLLRYVPGDPAELAACLQQSCDALRKIVRNLGVRTLLQRNHLLTLRFAQDIAHDNRGYLHPSRSFCLGPLAWPVLSDLTWPLLGDPRGVAEWVSYLREDKLWGNDDPLFPATRIARGESLQFEVSGLDRKHWSNASPIRIIFREAFERAGLPYFNPHSFRNTLVRLGLDKCQTPEEFKAWSQNLGHEKVLTTFLNYGEVASDRQREIIRHLATPPTPRSDFNDLVEAVAKQLRQPCTDLQAK